MRHKSGCETDGQQASGGADRSRLPLRVLLLLRARVRQRVAAPTADTLWGKLAGRERLFWSDGKTTETEDVAACCVLLRCCCCGGCAAAAAAAPAAAKADSSGAAAVRARQRERGEPRQRGAPRQPGAPRRVVVAHASRARPGQWCGPRPAAAEASARHERALLRACGAARPHWRARGSWRRLLLTRAAARPQWHGRRARLVAGAAGGWRAVALSASGS